MSRKHFLSATHIYLLPEQQQVIVLTPAPGEAELVAEVPALGDFLRACEAAGWVSACVTAGAIQDTGSQAPTQASAGRSNPETAMPRPGRRARRVLH